MALTEGDTTYAVIEVTSVDATTSKGYTLEIYRESLQVFAQQAYIKASNTGNYDAFGDSLALSGDTLAVGADSEDSSGTGVNSVTQGDNSAAGSGAVYVFY
ncbi:MAG: hypothetical protein GY820_15235 [Gammaproteobacteria bacterium]|nr:hypothetical protein [Gammaproteobacteria bacterium]